MNKKWLESGVRKLFFAEQPASPSSPRQCAQCPEGTFSEGLNPSFCTAQPDCPAGTYVFTQPTATQRRECTPVAYDRGCDCECRKDLPQNCSLWEPGVTIKQHTGRYHEELASHTFCLAFPGDGWSSRVLDAVVHGCIPVIVQDESYMFFESVFSAVGLDVDYDDFSVRVGEGELPLLVQRLKAIPNERRVAMRRLVLRLRDYFVYKDMYNPHAADRATRTSASNRPNCRVGRAIARDLRASSRALQFSNSSASRSAAPTQQVAPPALYSNRQTTCDNRGRAPSPAPLASAS